jgi:hypothetical protein
MNDQLTNMWNDALEQINDSLGENFIFRGTGYTGIINDVDFTAAFGGDALNPTLGNTIVLAVTAVDEAPEIGELVHVRGKRGKIAGVSSDEISYTLTVVTSDK